MKTVIYNKATKAIVDVLDGEVELGGLNSELDVTTLEEVPEGATSIEDCNTVYDYNKALAAAYEVQNKYMDPNFKDLYVQGLAKGLTGETVPNFNSYNKFMNEDLWPEFKARAAVGSIDYDFTMFKPATECDYDTLMAEVVGYGS